MRTETSLSFSTSLSDLCAKLNDPVAAQKAIVGFDGFIDEILHVVDIRFSPDSYQRISSIQAYADRIAHGSGMSTNIELVSQQTKIGGNGPILSNALLNYSVEVTYIGSVGFPDLDPTFQALDRCKEIFCLCPPAQTDALEFNDGKIISSKLTSLNHVTWENIRGLCSTSRLVALFEEYDYFVFSNWSMILDMNHIWEEFLINIVPLINAPAKSIFFDLADPEKRTGEDLRAALFHLVNFTKAGLRVTLSMNLKEACEISEVLGKTIPDYQKADTSEILDFLSVRLEFFCIVIHLVDRACCLHNNSYYEVDGPFCREPKLTTGAGDNFNAGFLYGIMQNFSFTDCLYMGCGTSGYYVRHANSPSIQELIDFFFLWKDNPTLS